MKFLFCSSRGRARKAGFYALFSKIFSFWLRIGAIFIRISDLWLRNGAILEPVFYLLWFSGAILEPNPIHGIKIDAILITSSLIPSRLSHLARVIFKKFIPSTYSQWEVTKLRVFFKNFSSHLFGLGEVVLVGVFEKISWYSVTVLESVYCPFTYSMFESHFVTPLTYSQWERHFLSSFQKNFRSLNPHLETVLSTYPSKISPTIPYSNFCGWKTTWFLKKFPHTPIPQL